MLFIFVALLWFLVYGLGIAGISTIMGLGELQALYTISTMAALMLPFRSVWYIVIAKKNHSRLHTGLLIQTAAEITTALLFLVLPRLSYQWFLVFLGIYFSFHIGLNVVNTIIFSRNRTFQYMIPSLAQSVLFTILFYGLLLVPAYWRDQLVVYGSGFFLALLGQAYMMDFLSVIIRNKYISAAFRRVCLTMPGFAGLRLPTQLLHTLQNDGDPKTADAEVFFSFGKGALGVVGHCELCVDGRTYTYGNYDPQSRILFKTIGNGVIIRAQRELQIQKLNQEGRTVISYGLRLSSEQKARLTQNLAEFQENLTPWDVQAKQMPAHEHLSCVHDKLDAQVFLITKGQFQSYFIPTINCVTLTANLLRGTSAGHMIIPGVYTPGAYMDALHRLYISGQSVVSSVHVYKPEKVEA